MCACLDRHREHCELNPALFGILSIRNVEECCEVLGATLRETKHHSGRVRSLEPQFVETDSIKLCAWLASSTVSPVMHAGADHVRRGPFKKVSSR